MEIQEDYPRKSRIWMYSSGNNWPSPGFVNSNSKWEGDISTRKIRNRNSNYRELISAGVDASSRYLNTATSIKSSDLFAICQVHSSIDGHTLQRYATGCPAAFTATTFLQKQSVRQLSNDARNRLNAKFLNAVQATYQSLDGSTFIGEFGETLHGLRHPAQSLFRGLGSYLSTITKRSSSLQKIRNRSKRIKAASDMVTGTYLEFRFGWNPLISDIEDAGKALNELVDGFGFLTKTVHASVSELDTSASGPGGNIPSPDGLFSWNTYNHVEEQILGRMYGVVKREINRPYTFREQLGLTPQNWIPAVWNVLPYSFVVDYFVNIGSCLSAAGTVTRDLYVCGLTTKNIRKRFTETTGFTSLQAIKQAAQVSGWIFDFATTSRATFEFDSFGIERTILNPDIDLYVIPVINLPTSSTKWINLTALGTQALAASRLLLK